MPISLNVTQPTFTKVKKLFKYLILRVTFFIFLINNCKIFLLLFNYRGCARTHFTILVRAKFTINLNKINKERLIHIRESINPYTHFKILE